jgi:outer membrane protein OmpA-like peptidoglycan-associated protein
MNAHPFRALSLLPGVAFAGALVAARPAAAQQQTFHLDRLEVPGAPDDGLVVFRPRVQDAAMIYGQLGLGLAVDPLRTGNITNIQAVQQASAANVITDQLSTYASVGIEFLGRFTFGLTFPAAWVEGGNQPSAAANPLLPAGAITAFSTNGPAIGDTRLDFRGVVWRSADQAWAFGAQLSVFVPTGTSDNFGGDGSASWLPMVNGEWTPPRFPLPLSFVANTGIHFRPENAINDPAGLHAAPQGLGVGNEWRWAVGALMPMGDRFRVGATIFGQTGLTFDGDTTVGRTFFTSQNTPIEWNAEGRMKVPMPALFENLFFGASVGTRLTDGYGGPDFRVLAVAGSYWTIEDTNPPSPDHRLRMTIHESLKDTDGDGIPDDIDACPTVPEDHQPPDPSDGCPAPPDRDHDGVPDSSDKCPDEPGGKGSVSGCPDTDHDGIPDAQDACPKEPGEPDPDPRRNGCPKHIRLEGSNVRVLQQVHFQTASATILADSFPMLTEMAKLLKANPDIKRMMIEGHTDNRGDADYNLDLSKRRAASVRTWLVGHGIEANRLQSEGYGLTRPVASNEADSGRAQNRRVEFKILEEGSGNGPTGR